jgi:hypothetical protein
MEELFGNLRVENFIDDFCYGAVSRVSAKNSQLATISYAQNLSKKFIETQKSYYLNRDALESLTRQLDCDEQEISVLYLNMLALHDKPKKYKVDEDDEQYAHAIDNYFFYW